MTEMRRRARTMLDTLAAGVGVLDAGERAMRARLCVLMLHRVLPDAEVNDAPLPGLVLGESVFERLVGLLASRYELCTLSAGHERVRNGPGDRPVVCLTFDDGYADNARVAAPILDAAGVPATFFVTTGFVAGQPLWHDLGAWSYRGLGAEGLRRRLREDAGAIDLNSLGAFMGSLKALTHAERVRLVERVRPDGPPPARAMSVEQIRALHARGHEIGAHTVTHPILTDLDDEHLRHELRDARVAIADWTGEPPHAIAYPNGDCDDRVARFTHEAGYSLGVTTMPAHNTPGADVLRLGRIDLTTDHLTRASGAFDGAAARARITLYRARRGADPTP